MKKRKFLAELQQRLEDKKFDTKEVERIVNDYEELIDEAIDHKKDEAKYIESLGSVNEIVRNINRTLKISKKKDHILVALSPFVATIAFFLLGFFFRAWHPGWLVFLGIPVIAVLTESNNPKRFIGLFPILYTILYILIGTYSRTPFVREILNIDSFRIGLLWHPFWAGYLYTAVLGYLFDKKLERKIVGVIDLVLVSAYLYFELAFGFRLWHFSFLLIMLALGVMTGTIKVVMDINLKSKKERRQSIITLVYALVVSIAYVTFSYIFGLWGVLWTLFLTIPIVAIGYEQYFIKRQLKVVEYMPFISVILFFLVGYYFNLFAISWLFFLLIPITGIIEDQAKPKKE